LSEVMTAVDHSERIAIGRKCKDLLDHGRLLWLERSGLKVKTVKYISSTITPENKLLLARRCFHNESAEVQISSSH
jgi:tRNA:m4X modification enzyme